MITESTALNFLYNKKDDNKPSFLADSAPYLGLRLLAYSSGNKTWIYRYRHKISGKLKQVRIGSYSSELNLSAARLIYSKYKSERDIGLCPATKLKEARAFNQMSEYLIINMLEDYHHEYIDQSRNKKGSKDFLRMITNQVIPLIGHFPVAYLDLELIADINIILKSPSTIESVRKALGASFEWAIRNKRIPSTKRKHTYRIKTKFMTVGEYK